MTNTNTPTDADRHARAERLMRAAALDIAAARYAETAQAVAETAEAVRRAVDAGGAPRVAARLAGVLDDLAYSDAEALAATVAAEAAALADALGVTAEVAEAAEHLARDWR